MAGRGRQWTVLIVEDDPVVARLHHRAVQAARGFEVMAIARSGTQALQLVESLHPDLMLLDIGLPGVDGIQLLRRIRLASQPTEVIAVTAAASVEVIRTALHLGVVDYLVKPFDPERLHSSLAQFVRRMLVLSSGSLEQSDVDVLRATAAPNKRLLPRELNPERLTAIRAVLGNSAAPLSAEEIGDTVGSARVTARRYLEYLVAVGQAHYDLHTIGAGRPRKLYSAAASGEAAGANTSSDVCLD